MRNFEIRISKSETNPNVQNSKFVNFYLFRTFEIWSFEIVSNFACLREAASAKAGISCFEFERSSNSIALKFSSSTNYSLTATA